MAKCSKCFKSGLEWEKTTGGKFFLEPHECVTTPPKKTYNKPVFGKKKEPINLLYGVTLTNEALERGLEKELGL